MPDADEPFIGEGPDHAPDGTRIRRGGCSCGAVRFELRGEPLTVGICHCTDCRKATGSAFFAYADWPPSGFSVTGEAREYHGRSFCPTCGSRLFHRSEDQVEIASAPSTPPPATSPRPAKAGSSAASTGSPRRGPPSSTATPTEPQQ